MIHFYWVTNIYVTLAIHTKKALQNASRFTSVEFLNTHLNAGFFFSGARTVIYRGCIIEDVVIWPAVCSCTNAEPKA